MKFTPMFKWLGLLAASYYLPLINLYANPLQGFLIKPSDLYQAPSKRVHINNLKKSFGLADSFSRADLSLSEKVRELLVSRGMDPQIRLVVESTGREKGNSYETYIFTINNFALCGYHALARESDALVPYITGNIPISEFGYELFASEDFPVAENVAGLVTEKLKVSANDIKINSAKKCLQATSNGLIPSLDMQIVAVNLPYDVVVSEDRVFDIESKFFAITGTVKGYKFNPLDTKQVTETVDFKGDGYMTTDKVTTTTGSFKRAHSSEHKFEYKESQEEFLEANAFLHVQRTYEWFKKLGYEWHTDQLTLRLRQNVPTFPGDTEGSPNNALYLPGGLSGRESPMIALAEGDGYFLANLHLDADVVSHEFGHHIIFRTLKSTSQVESSGEGPSDTDNHSAALHEGLADFFTFAQTGDACLGESICPAGSGACWTRTAEVSCLRVGNSDLVYNSDFYWSLGGAFHHKGQVVSALLYDVLTHENVDSNEFSKLAFKALDYLPASSTYTDLILGLMSADREYYSGKYGCMIAEAATARGFDFVIDEYIDDCGKFNDVIEVTQQDSNINETSGQTKVPSSTSSGKQNTSSSSGTVESGGGSSSRSSGGGGGCGVVQGGQNKMDYSLLFFMVALGVPIVIINTNVSKKALVRVRSEQKAKKT